MKENDINTIRAEVDRLRLEGRETVAEMSAEELAAAYNGTGPEWFPPKWREKLDAKLRVFLPAVMVHDCDFERSDGRVAAFDEANRRLLRNCLKCAKDAASWHDPRRYALFIEAIAMYRFCVKTGWIAWRMAWKANITKAYEQDS